MIVGQKHLLNELNKYDINTFPHSVIILGEEGSGKKKVARYISEEVVKLPLLDITENISD